MIAAKSHKVQGLESIIMLIIIGLLIKKFILTHWPIAENKEWCLFHHSATTAKRGYSLMVKP